MDNDDKKGKPGVRTILLCAGGALALVALGFAALALRSCLAEVKSASRQKTETRVYEYGASLSREGKILVASKSSGFVIPREFAKKLILGLTSTAKVQISCQAEIDFYIEADDLRNAEYRWEGLTPAIRVARPKALRPIIETSSIKRAILDRGFAFNERAELDILLAQLSDLVAGSADSGLDDATLETGRLALESIIADALSGLRGRPIAFRVEWR